MTKLNIDYYVFDGQNATTGSPNRITGRMSNYGNTLKFKTKKEALEYVEDYRGYAICRAGTKKTMRTYDLGCSVAIFEEYFHMVGYTTKNENGYWK